uniref:Uncharacterized protein n=1 Tax=Romanomermis culicivorax TaxID=13658 RepID=A0A915JDM3_ROMCU
NAFCAGAAGGGKTTILKQLRILHQDKFEESELRQHKRVIHANIVKMAAEILEYLLQHNQELSKVSAAGCIDIFKKVDYNRSEFVINPDLATLLLALRADTVFRHCYMQTAELSFMVSTKYYFENLDRICAPEYTPNDQDILRNRVSTTGVVELRLTIQGRPFR